MKPRLGFVGLGNIGDPVCRQLLAAGYRVLVHDANPEAAAKLEDTTAKPVKNLQDLASEADVVLLSDVRRGHQREQRPQLLDEVKFPNYILSRSFDDGFALALMNKGIGIALEAAAEMDFPMRVGPQVRELWQIAAETGYASENHTAFYAFLEVMVREGGAENESS